MGKCPLCKLPFSARTIRKHAEHGCVDRRKSRKLNEGSNATPVVAPQQGPASVSTSGTAEVAAAASASLAAAAPPLGGADHHSSEAFEQPQEIALGEDQAFFMGAVEELNSEGYDSGEGVVEPANYYALG